MKKIINLILITVISVTMFSCNRIDGGHVGIKVNLYGSEKGVSDITEVTGITFKMPVVYCGFCYTQIFC
jgi:hypothetical protein